MNSPALVRVFLIVLAYATTIGLTAPSLAQSSRNKSARDTLTIKAEMKGRTIIGNPLAWDGKKMQILRRDGRTTLVPVTGKDDYKVLPQKFTPYAKEKMVKRLRQEFGSKYHVSVTPSFLVVHPIGDYHTWAKPFEDLNERFAAYFQTRGVRIDKPEFPLVAVVLRTRGEFDRMLSAYHDSPLSSRTLGYYSPVSNRIITYDQSNGRDKNWFFDTDTVVHEATHQTAFNRGIHSRFGGTARWVTEGLACMFEAEGVHNSYIHTKQVDRVNRGRMTSLMRMISSGKAKGTLERMVRDDRIFETSPELAYAYAWGLTFFLAETKPKEYLKFLTEDAKREIYSNYSRTDRIEQFSQAFGSDFEKIEAQMFNYLKKVKIPTAQRLSAR